MPSNPFTQELLGIAWNTALVLCLHWAHKTDILEATVQCQVGEADNKQYTLCLVPHTVKKTTRAQSICIKGNYPP